MLAEPLKFAQYELDPVRRVLRRNGKLIALRPKAFTLLSILIENHDRIVTKEELLAALWPDGFGTEANLTVNIAAIRKVLGEEPREHRFVVTVPTVGYRFVAPIGAPALTVSEANPRLARGSRLAVLPFLFGGSEEFQSEAEYSDTDLLSFGLADSLVTGLSELPNLSIRNPLDVQRIAKAVPDRSLEQIARELHVDAVLSGIVTTQRDQCTIDLSVLQAEENREVWSIRINHPCHELQALPMRLTRLVVGAMRGPAEGERIGAFDRRYTARDDAFQLYLQGRYHYWNGQSPARLQRAVDCFRRAIDLDADYALAHCGLAETYLQLWTLGLATAPDFMEKARQSATDALTIDPLLSDAHRAMGMVFMLLDWNWSEAREHFLAAIDFQPSNALAYDCNALYLASNRRFDEALTCIRRAQELDPISLRIHSDMATVLHFAGQTEEAMRMLEGVVERDPDFFMGHLLQGWVRLAGADAEGAIRIFDRLAELIGRNAWVESLVGTACAAAGQEERARECLRSLEARARAEIVQPTYLATILMHLGETEAAMEKMREAVDARYPYLVYLDCDPLWNPLRDHPEFGALRRRVFGPTR